MRLVPLIIALAVQVSLVLSLPLAKGNVDYYDPRLNSGSMLDSASRDKHGNIVGEPLNVIISGKSSPQVLTKDGLVNWARAIGFSVECLGMHIGTPQTANLGDGNGDVEQGGVLREAYGLPSVGTCWESLVGGNHFRYWYQNGPQANSGAIFLAASQELDAPFHHHMITENGYNIGRDKLVKAARGIKVYGDYTYNTTVSEITDLMEPGIKGVNHAITVDKTVYLLTVKIINP